MPNSRTRLSVTPNSDSTTPTPKRDKNLPSLYPKASTTFSTPYTAKANRTTLGQYHAPPSHLHGEDNRAPASRDEVRAGSGDHERGTCGLCVRAEQVGAHSRHVTHVVSNIVGDRGRVARVILFFFVFFRWGWRYKDRCRPQQGFRSLDLRTHQARQAFGMFVGDTDKKHTHTHKKSNGFVCGRPTAFTHHRYATPPVAGAPTDELDFCLETKQREDIYILPDMVSLVRQGAYASRDFHLHPLLYSTAARIPNRREVKTPSNGALAGDLNFYLVRQPNYPTTRTKEQKQDVFPLTTPRFAPPPPNLVTAAGTPFLPRGYRAQPCPPGRRPRPRPSCRYHRPRGRTWR